MQPMGVELLQPPFTVGEASLGSVNCIFVPETGLKSQLSELSILYSPE